MGKERPILAPSPPMISSYNALYFLHFAVFTLYTYTFFWHFGLEASKLPQAEGFGWYTKYITCWSFFLQLCTLFICNLCHRIPQGKSLQTLADDLTCAVFSIANGCNVAYWLKFFLTLPPKQTVHPYVLDIPPLWLLIIMHVLNSVTVALDLLLAKRSFRIRSWRIIQAFSASYIVWINICAFVNKRYPYDFLNALPQPQGFLIIATMVYVAFGLFFKLGSKLAKRVGEEEKPKHL